MILLLGATSYVGQGFARALRRRKDSFIPLSRHAFDYTRFEFLFDYIRKVKPDLVINAADYPEKPNHDAAAIDRSEMLQINTLLPQTVARACSLTNTTFGHVSSGSIYSGAKVVEKGGFRIEEELGLPELRELLQSHPEKLMGFNEADEPNFSFNSTPCTFYSGTKALAEQALRASELFIWRLRLPFNEVDDPHNLLSQFQDGFRVPDTINSVSHLDECVAACLELWERHAAFGIYNVVNPGPVRTEEIARLIQRCLKPAKMPQLLVYQEDEPQTAEKSPRSDCILDVSKLLRAGVKLRTATQALEHSLQHWTTQPAPVANSLP
jgi:UDP-glucose 4,6-dehydratase